MTEGTAEHLRPEQLYPLLWACREKQATVEGDEGDAELRRMFDDMDERFRRPLAPEHRLGPETVERLWEHSIACPECRMQLIEDGPGSRPPKTEAEVQQEIEDKDAARRKLVIKFWIDLVVGLAFFSGGFVTVQTIRNKQVVDQAEEVMRAVGAKEIDPLWYLFVVLIMGASWFLAEAYTIARDLWIDFTAWKRAVPVIGKAWADRDKNKNRPQ